jgi:hypothetical protein
MLNKCVDADPNGVVPGSDLYLAADLSLSCSSDRYHFGVIYAKCMIVVYPVGIPLFYLAVLWWNKNKILQYHRDVANNMDADEVNARNPVVLPMRYLFGCYKPEFWYFEVIETLRRLLLTGFLTLIYPGATKQLVVGIFINVLFVAFYSFLSPYNEEELQFSSFLCQCQLILVFFVSILIKENVAISSGLINAMLILCIFSGIFYEAFLLPMIKYYSSHLVEGNKNEKAKYEEPHDVENLNHIQHISGEGEGDVELSEKDIVLQE